LTVVLVNISPEVDYP